VKYAKTKDENNMIANQRAFAPVAREILNRGDP
jgi:hypothetical protein